MEHLEMRRTQLTERLRELHRRFGRIEDELAGHAETDWEDMATEREADEVLEGMGVAALQEVRLIEAALARIDAGDYGLCMVCGRPIAEGRLDLLPHTPVCREHAA